MDDTLTIGFVTMGLPFNGHTLETKGLGGSETAALCMAREFAKLGHEVYMFCECPSPGLYDGVNYSDVRDFTKTKDVLEFDVLIASRWPEFLDVPSSAGLRVLWLHDMMTDPSRLLSQTWQTDICFMLSDYHLENYLEGKDAGGYHADFLRPIAHKTSNGVDYDLISEIRSKTEEQPFKVMFTSRPERGLDYLLTEIMPELIREIPQIELHYCNYSLQGMEVPDHVKIAHQIVNEQAERYPNNVKNLGHLTKVQLYEQMCSAKLQLYPTSFPEISCLSAMEAQACGTPIITTDNFALSETVGPGGVKIKGKPGEEAYKAKFIRKVLMLLKDEATRQDLREKGIQWVLDQGYTWELVAKSWETLFKDKLNTRVKEQSRAIIQELVRNGDVQQARMLASDLADKELIEGTNRVFESVNYLLQTVNDNKHPEVVRYEWKQAIPTFRKAMGLLEQTGSTPKVIWDLTVGDPSFSVGVRQWLPKDVTAYGLCHDQEMVNRCQAILEKQNDGATVQLVIAPRLLDAHKLQLPKPDLIYLGGTLETEPHPIETLELALRLVGENGFVLATSEFGPTHEDGTKFSAPMKLWNFSSSDWSDMVGEGGASTTLAVGEETVGGDKTGVWFVLMPGGKRDVALPSSKRKARRTRPYQSLAFCMIAKDEEDWITGCLKKIYPIADEIVVALDSRTSDATRELLKASDPRDKIEIREVEFEHFSQMRNASIEGVKSDWIFWIDADERLTNPEKIRPLLQSQVHEGYAIKQCHLMLDVHGTFDAPVRLYKNREKYRFVGCIHEHCESVDPEDLAKNGFNNPIKPHMLLQRSVLAHYGYLDEPQRRQKCSNRNMALLRKDIEVFGNNGRRLSFVLAIRDLNNIAKWSCNLGPFARGSKEHALLEASIQVFHKHFAHTKDRFYELSFGMYQEALRMLGERGIPVGDRPAPPFCVSMTLQGSVGGEPTQQAEPNVLWFIDPQDHNEFFAEQHMLMLSRMNLTDPPTMPPSKVDVGYDPNWPELLTLGEGAITSQGFYAK